MESLMGHEEVTDDDMHGWLPIRAWLRDGEWRVDWCWFGEQRLTQPFYRDEVDLALRLPFNQAFRRDTPLATLLDWQAASPGLTPGAFIFHASRCGSTLLAQMLADGRRGSVDQAGNPTQAEALGMTDLNGGALFNAEFGIRHRAAPYRKGQVLHSDFAAALGYS